MFMWDRDLTTYTLKLGSARLYLNKCSDYSSTGMCYQNIQVNEININHVYTRLSVNRLNLY